VNPRTSDRRGALSCTLVRSLRQGFGDEQCSLGRAEALRAEVGPPLQHDAFAQAKRPITRQPNRPHRDRSPATTLPGRESPPASTSSSLLAGFERRRTSLTANLVRFARHQVPNETIGLREETVCPVPGRRRERISVITAPDKTEVSPALGSLISGIAK
jgi:hypothetical protein